MAKAEKKDEVITETGIPSGMQAKDLSLEKRIELYTKVFEDFKKETQEKFGLALDVEIIYSPRAALPRLVLVDLLKKENANKQTPEKNPDQTPKA